MQPRLNPYKVIKSLFRLGLIYPKHVKCAEYLSDKEKELLEVESRRDTQKRMPTTSADEMAVWVDVHVSAGC